MKKVLFSTAAAAMLLMWFATPAMAWKVIREEGDAAGSVKSIHVVDDRLIIVTATGVHDLRLSQLDQLPAAARAAAKTTPAPVAAPAAPAPAPAPAVPALPADATLAEKVAAGLKTNFSWYVLSGKARGFKVMGRKLVRTFQDGDLFRGTVVNSRLYLQDTNEVIYEPTWEISYDFTRFVVPLATYLKKQTANIERLRIAIADREKELAENKQLTLFYVDEIVRLLKNNSYTTAKLYNQNGDVNFNLIRNEDLNPNSMLFYNELRSKLHRLISNRRKLEKDIATYRRDLGAAVEQVEQFQTKMDQTRK